MDNFKIRFATIKDAEIIFNFIKSIAKYEKLSQEVEGNVQMVEQTIFIDKTAEVIIAEENGVPVGFALFFHSYSTFKTSKCMYLEDLFVDPNMRGKGYGKALILEVIKLAKERNCARMDWCCLDWNAPSIEFYKSLGATPMDEWTIYRLNKEQINQF